MSIKGNPAMKIAVLSGKGGTGKTLVSVNLASAAKNAVYMDCDVEEPNGHLFFKPEPVSTLPVTVKIPQVDENLCNGCRVCVGFCRFHALAMVGDKWMVFDDVCHSCGGCTLFCPQKALSEIDKPIGRVEVGRSDGVDVISGFLNPGQATGIPIIETMFAAESPQTKPVIVDCPPGSACIVMESIKDADYCVLVAEPTLFGLHNLKMVHELVKLFDKPYGVILNKCMPGTNPSKEYCKEEGIKILVELPFDDRIGELNSNGKILVHEDSKYEDLFSTLLKKINQEVAYETAVNPER
jgi:MinD superfamily P-loop ATPase